ncbi:ABC transporter permease [Microbacterium hominis]|uniref:ABC transporter permease n=1 Tax=Microbacterium hominis TaxID=162426 RepID=A0A7D4UH92_9MICO|nr:ABC transporter permease [Microbacterium hominis]QKJ18248.1 ABC transporter permease [Microbacterium hominis]
MMEILAVLTSATFLTAVLRVATPYLFAALGGVIAERAGVPNIALEGQMLSAACVGVLVAGATGNVWLGAACGVATGALLGVLLTAIVLELKADPIIVGIGVNLLASGGTAFLVFTLLGDKGGTTGLNSGTLPPMTIPGLDAIPVLGPLLGTQNILTFGAFLALLLVWWLMYRARFGYHMRAVGEADAAATMVGISVRRVKYSSMALSGALAGCGGVFLSMGAVSFFLREMTAGRGYIALAAVFLGGVRPVGAFIAALVFGAAEAAAIQLGAFEIPTQLITAIPYAITLIALAVFSTRVRQVAKDWRFKRRVRLV